MDVKDVIEEERVLLPSQLCRSTIAPPGQLVTFMLEWGQAQACGCRVEGWSPRLAPRRNRYSFRDQHHTHRREPITCTVAQHFQLWWLAWSRGVQRGDALARLEHDDGPQEEKNTLPLWE